MPSATSTDQQLVELLIFDTKGRALVVGAGKERHLPSSPKSNDYSLQDQAVILAGTLGISVTKMAPLYGQSKNGVYKVTFLVITIDSVSIPPEVQGLKTGFLDLVSLTSSEVSNGCEYYKTLLQAVLSNLFPLVIPV